MATFREDRDFSFDAPEIDDMRKNWRHIPQRPTGLYLAYINELIAQNHSKRDDAADDEYWNRRRENELLKDKPREAA
jgi:hypothetical protein